MNKFTKIGFITLTASSIILFNGCSSEAVQLASSLGANGVKALSSGLANSISKPKIATSAQAQKGYVEGTKIANSLASNPTALAVTSLSMAQSKRNEEANKAAFAKLQTVMNDPSSTQKIQAQLVIAYNQKHGTHYKTYEELQEAVRNGTAN